MTVATDNLPLTETLAPANQSELVRAVQGAYENSTPVYPIGGGTSLDLGLPATEPGMGLSLANLNRVIDYPARDMTVTVEAGITLAELARTLAAERQWLPVEGPAPASATLGGLVATAHSGPRRYGYGTMRDYVIGITAVDGRGVAFKAGGRVVKNVAGYDFCKLLTGSLGTVGVITQLTLKVRPRPERSAFVACELPSVAAAEPLLAAIVTSTTTPVAVELLTGPAWREHASLGLLTAGNTARLVVAFEGTAEEVTWCEQQLAAEWRTLGVNACRAISGEPAETLWRDLRDFPATSESPLVLKAGVLPSRLTPFVELVQNIDPQASVQAHAGNGIVLARFARFEAGDISRALIGRLQPAAQHDGGSACVLSSTLSGLTRQAVWGNVNAATHWMTRVKRQFDPKNLLNRGRFVYDIS